MEQATQSEAMRVVEPISRQCKRTSCLFVVDDLVYISTKNISFPKGTLQNRATTLGVIVAALHLLHLHVLTEAPTMGNQAPARYPLPTIVETSGICRVLPCRSISSRSHSLYFPGLSHLNKRHLSGILKWKSDNCIGIQENTNVDVMSDASTQIYDTCLLFCNILFNSFGSTTSGSLLYMVNRLRIRKSFNTHLIPSYWTENWNPSKRKWAALTRNKRSISFRRNWTPIIFGTDDKSRTEYVDSGISCSQKSCGLSNIGWDLGTRGPNWLFSSVRFASLRLLLRHHVKSANHIERTKDPTWLDSSWA